MRCLWLTWIEPTPEHDGQRIYSGRLIDAVASAGAEVDVLCFARDAAASRTRNCCTNNTVRWSLVQQQERAPWQSFFSHLPHIAHRSGTHAMKRRFAELLAERHWDSVVMDGLYTGWALPLIDARSRPSRLPTRHIYISHNHEETTRALVASNYDGGLFRGAAVIRDAQKAARLERRMVDRADFVTAVTREDAERFAARRPEKPVLVISPGYAGRRLGARQIDDGVPRRALLVGSFEWLAKQMNLKEFLAIADPVFAAAGLELQVVGNGERAFFDSLRPGLKSTEIVGPVEDIGPYLDRARVAIIPERSGGGFKLKILDYVFNRLPVAALEQSIAGIPLQPHRSILTFPRYEELARGVVNVIDDFNLLNGLQEQAFAACAGAFDWQKRGQRLLSALAGYPAHGVATEPV
ncbi:MAG TPA: glycosyltransferase [Parvibaculum sp.]